MVTPRLMPDFDFKKYRLIRDQSVISYPGFCWDPLLAKINHCCFPSARYTFEGNQLRVFAGARNLEAGQELTIFYLDNHAPPRRFLAKGERHDVGKRRDWLSSWCFKCTCCLCQDNPQAYPNVNSTEYFENLCKAIDHAFLATDEDLERDLKDAHKHLEDGSQRGLHCFAIPLCKRFILGYQLRNEFSPQYYYAFLALKWIISQYFYVEPTQSPKPSLEERLATLYILIQVLIKCSIMGDVSSPAFL